ncbi:DUF2199 domain-containing protein [Kribbella catacumbae]|uniref:DUF2199 domain-containing protein n=1 Tax=Kribbella catacumbae TaxID=460086 RepID=UPI0012FBD22D|nr:DUF2199 domain-containing protein [Kribbella catacumbae]
MPTETCPTCGRPTDAHDRHIRFQLPTPLYDLPDWEQLPGLWMSHQTPTESVMLQADGFGAFVRALLPVQLEGGHKLTYGVWVGVHPDQLQQAFAVWWDDSPAYLDLRLDGRLANRIDPWDLLGVPVVATVLDQDTTPVCTSSDDPLLTRVLAETWPHDEALP